jgi:cytochrome P450
VTQSEHDDIVPLTSPVTLPDSTMTNQIVVAKGQTIVVHMQAIGHSRAFWGPNAWEFVPERWLSDLPEKATAFTAYRHLLTFSDGPKVYVYFDVSLEGGEELTFSRCLGRSFAVTNIKVALAVLLRKFSFAMVDGPETKIEDCITIAQRPKEESMPGPVVRMKVKSVE